MVRMLGNSVISFIVKDAAQVKIHKHYCFQVIIALKGSFTCTIAEETYTNVHGFIVNSDVQHACAAPDCTVVVNFIDADSAYGKNLRKFLNERDVLFLPKATVDSANGIMAEDYETMLPSEQAAAVNRYLDNLIPAADEAAFKNDERITKAINYIEENLATTITVDCIAEKVSLSSHRLRHLFKAETGMPLSHYILWKRIKKVLALAYIGTTPINVASGMYNFPDQSHFNHMFMKIFGVPPTSILKSFLILQ